MWIEPLSIPLWQEGSSTAMDARGAGCEKNRGREVENAPPIVHIGMSQTLRRSALASCGAY